MAHCLGELVILTKAPRAANGKSRLAAAIGAGPATELAEAFLIDTTLTSASEEWRTTIHFTPAWARAEIAALSPGVAACPQSGDDLGERIASAMTAALATNARVVLIGSDSPNLPRRMIREAFIALEEVPAVLGPAADGGFYLIGLRDIPEGLFDGVAWSTPTVCETVANNLDHRGMNVRLLEPWADIDDLPSLAALADRLASGGSAAPATAGVLARYQLFPAQIEVGA